MSAEAVFLMANTAAGMAWILLAVLPGAPAVKLVTRTLVPGLFAMLYVGIVLSAFGSSGGGFSTLAEVQTLFSNRWMLLAGWVHYLAFDLLVGAWEVDDARTRGLPRLVVLPCLALTFLFGPAGWLLYRLVRRAMRKNQ
jgi:hypothetical protein